MAFRLDNSDSSQVRPNYPLQGTHNKRRAAGDSSFAVHVLR